MATYLELVNEVLVRLREPTVSSVSGSYPELIGSFVNRAKEKVERAADWQVLRTEVTLSTTDGVAEYSLTGTDRKTRLYMEWDSQVQQYLPMVYANSTNYYGRLHKKELRMWIHSRKVDTIQRGKPYTYAIIGRANTGEMRVGLMNEPDGAYSIDFTLIQPEPKLTGDTDTTYLPEEPIIQYAYALAFSERGEDAGASVDETMMKALETLSEFVSTEASWADHEYTLRAD